MIPPDRSEVSVSKRPHDVPLWTVALCALLVALPAGPGLQGREAPNGAVPSQAATPGPARLQLGTPDVVRPGVELYLLHDPTLLVPPGPVAVQALRLDPAKVVLRSALALDQVLGTESVADTARRHRAIAAINAGFFLPNGDPAGVLKVSRELVSDSRTARGAVGITEEPGKPVRLIFDRVTAVVRLRVRGRAIRVDGVDTTRRPGELTWFTPRFFDHTDTTDEGVECVLRGAPLTVVECRQHAMRTAIPRDGAVLSIGGRYPGGIADQIRKGDVVEPSVEFISGLGTRAEEWMRAADVVSGAGLLVGRGQPLTDWTPEKLRAGFSTERHPRTLIGVAKDGRIWLITVDGRNPLISLGMNFAELQRLARGLGLREALNLVGGGSTTMVVGDRIVNHPSDPTGPRKVSDSILVFERSSR
jgi:hypothetical protein